MRSDLSFNAERDDFGGRLQTLSRNTGKRLRIAGAGGRCGALRRGAAGARRGQIAACSGARCQRPDAVASAASAAAAWPGHPYRAPARGELRRGRCGDARGPRRRSHQRLWRAKTLKIAVVGAIDAATSRAISTTVFGCGCPRTAALDAGAGDRSVGPRAAHHRRYRRAAGQSSASAGQGIARRDPDYITAMRGQPRARRRRRSPRGCSRRCAKSAAWPIRSRRNPDHRRFRPIADRRHLDQERARAARRFPSSRPNA